MIAPLRVLAVTSWGGACGIFNYAEQLIAAVGAADPGIVFTPNAEALDPAWVQNATGYDVIWLNYHRGLHSRWTPEVLTRLRQHAPWKVVITFHDTYGDRPPDPLAQSLHDLADAFVVHEPCLGLERQILIRQGVPAANCQQSYAFATWHRAYYTQPVLGTVGFNFPWKNFDRLADVTAAYGWAYLVCSNNATDEDEARWKAANPDTLVIRGFQPTETLVGLLAECDATCFAYECANSGTSGAIRLGLAARKPVIAFEGCRQFRDLRGDHEIQWVSMWSYLPNALGRIPIQRVDPGIAALAHRDSWVHQGQRYAAIFRGAVEAR